MAIKPDFFKPYHLSDIRQGATYKDGKRTFRGYGTDSTDRTDNIIYITHIGLKRMVSFKAFIESYKLNLSKKIEFFQEGDKNDKPMSEYGTDISYSLVINVPAHSVNESRNNMAKLEEIQRLISTMGNETERSILYGTNLSIFSVWFKNLICSGYHYKSYPNTTNVDIDTVIKLGFLCYIDKIDFQPDIEAGFFDYDDVTDRKNGKFLFPKNIKLNMQLKYGSQPNKDLNDKLKAKEINNSEPVAGFDYNGDYVITDNGGWPLNLYVSSKKTEFLGRKPDIYEDDMNDIGKEYMSKNSFVFLCNSYKKTDSGIERGILFKPFIESFNRNYEQSYPVISGDKGREFGEVLDTSTTSTFKSLDYKFKVQVPSESLEEAIRNTAKIQYLVRLFVKKFKPSKIIESSNRKAAASRVMTIYIPSFLEKANASTFQTTSYDAMVENGLGLIVTNITFDIDLEQGFFEKDGKLFPKSYSLDFEATSFYSDLIVNYGYSDGDYYMLDSSTIKGEEHLFPFNRQTSKLILGL